ncbi:unnamed protein product [Pedinophyceae sp. YPF-701]|nr:unnamed protein product [Pedinophyceae sp. YPF-701]
MVAAGEMLGPDQPVILHLLDIEPAKQRLDGLAMELVDAAFPLLKGVVATTSLEEACKDVDIAVLVGGFPRGPGMERKDLMAKNAPIFGPQGAALEKFASKDVRVLVVANPANTNAWLVSKGGPGIPKENITALTRLDHNRTIGQISEMTSVPNSEVKNVIIWGNHSATQYPDVNHGTVAGKPIREKVGNDEYLNGEFIKLIQQRGKAVINMRGASSALSAAHSACDHVRSWMLGTPGGEWTSMAVLSDGNSYGIPNGIVYSFPVKCKAGKWEIVSGLKIDDMSRKLMDATAQELVDEQKDAQSVLSA